MEGGQLTLWKDIDRKIIENLDEKSILSICSTSSKFFNQICNDSFIQNLLEKRYPGSTQYKPKTQSWKNFLLTIFYWKGKLKEEFNYDYAGGNFETQYKLFSKYKKKSQTMYELLSEAARYNELNIVKYAVERGADLDNQAPLNAAVRNGNMDMIKYLVDKGANDHGDLLAVAAGNGKIEAFKYLLSKGLELDIQTKRRIKEHVNNTIDFYNKYGGIEAIKSYQEILSYLD